MKFPLQEEEIYWLLTSEQVFLQKKLLDKLVNGLSEESFNTVFFKKTENIIRKLIHVKRSNILLEYLERLVLIGYVGADILSQSINKEIPLSIILLRHIPDLDDKFLLSILKKYGQTYAIPISEREYISPLLARHILEKGCRISHLKLLRRKDITLDEDILSFAYDKYQNTEEMREILLSRQDLPFNLLGDEIFQSLQNLEQYISMTNLMPAEDAHAMFGFAYDRIILEIGRKLNVKNFKNFIIKIKESDYITPTLIHRAIIMNDMPFVINLFSILSGYTYRRISTLFYDGGELGYEVLAEYGGLEKQLMPDIYMLVKINKKINEEITYHASKESFCLDMISSIYEIVRTTKLQLSPLLTKSIEVLYEEASTEKSSIKDFYSQIKSRLILKKDKEYISAKF